MDIYVNSKLVDLPITAKINDTLASLGINSANGIAIAVNDTVVSRASWTDHVLQQGDKITIIKATQGG